jgi:hypothetical protein
VVVLLAHGRRRVERLHYPAIAVAAHEQRPVAERSQALDRLDRHRARHNVAPDDDRVEARALDFGEDGIERRGVGVDVVERGNSHRGDMLASHLRVTAPRSPPLRPAVDRLTTALLASKGSTPDLHSHIARSIRVLVHERRDRFAPSGGSLRRRAARFWFRRERCGAPSPLQKSGRCRGASGR